MKMQAIDGTRGLSGPVPAEAESRASAYVPERRCTIVSCEATRPKDIVIESTHRQFETREQDVHAGTDFAEAVRKMIDTCKKLTSAYDELYGRGYVREAEILSAAHDDCVSAQQAIMRIVPLLSADGRSAFGRRSEELRSASDR